MGNLLVLIKNFSNRAVVFFVFCLLSCVSLFCKEGFAQEGSLAQNAIEQNSIAPGNKYVSPTIVSNLIGFQPRAGYDEPVARVGILFKIEAGWHIYWRNSGDAAIPTKVEWKLPTGWNVGETIWPSPTRFIETEKITTFGYRDEALIVFDLFGPNSAPEGENIVELKAEVAWLVCREICVPGRLKLAKNYQFSTSIPLAESEYVDKFKAVQDSAPRNISQLSELPLLAGRKVLTSLSRTTENGGFLGSIELPFELNSLQDQIQLFPYKLSGVQFGSPKFVRKEEKNFIVFPINGAVSLPISITGILLFSPQLLNTKVEQSYEWQMNYDQSNTGNALINDSDYRQSANFLHYKTAISEVKRASATKMPLSASNTVSTKISAPNKILRQDNQEFAGLSLVLFWAFLGGLILNLMPCVLPVISIKVASFIEQGDKSRSAALSSALIFSFGVISTFLVLASTVVLLRELGSEVGWGFQFQHPEFVLLLTLIIFVLSLGFFEFCQFNLPFLNQANRAATKVKSEFGKNFLDGVLATLLSTPCTAPFLGSALAFAFAQSTFVIFLVFISISLGLSLPYVILSTSPRLLRLLPKPGEWMNVFKQFMGFLLLGTVCWLLFILQQQTQSAVAVVILLLVVFFCLWMRKSFSSSRRLRSVLLDLFILAFFSLAVNLLWSEITVRKKVDIERAFSSEIIEWKPYSEELLKSARESDRPVFIDFTADWCITCKVNETVVIETTEVANIIKERDFLALKGDWTNADARITRALKSFAGQGVPYYVVISKKGDLKVLPSLLTKEILLEALME